MMDFKEFIKECRRPFPPEAVLSRVQATSGDNDSALVVYYIDARHVSERLNQLVPGEWSQKYMPIILGDQVGVECQIAVRVEDEGVIHRADIGTKLADDSMGGLKAMYSDAFKRAAVHLGIGVSLYAQETNWVPAEKDGVTFIKKNKGGKPAYLQEPAIKTLKEKYTRWLNDVGEEKFGKPVDVS